MNPMQLPLLTKYTCRYLIKYSIMMLSYSMTVSWRRLTSRTSSYVSFSPDPLLQHRLRESINRSPTIIAMSRLLPCRIRPRHLLSPTRPASAKFRSFHNTAPTMVSASDISPSRGENTEELTSQTTALVDSGRWKLWDNGKGLERQFRFKTFKATWVCLLTFICLSTHPSCHNTRPFGRIYPSGRIV
jgi:hypothetical protein